MIRRVALAVGAITFVKLLFRFLILGTFAPNSIVILTAVDVLGILLAAPWVVLGPPRPKPGEFVRRALYAVVAIGMLNGGITFGLQTGRLFAASGGLLEIAILALFTMVPTSILNGPGVGPIWGLLTWMIAFVAAFIVLRLRIRPDRPAAHAPPVPHAPAAAPAGGTRTAAPPPLRKGRPRQ
jgi:hypothetical protein